MSRLQLPPRRASRRAARAVRRVQPRCRVPRVRLCDSQGPAGRGRQHRGCGGRRADEVVATRGRAGRHPVRAQLEHPGSVRQGQGLRRDRRLELLVARSRAVAIHRGIRVHRALAVSHAVLSEVRAESRRRVECRVDHRARRAARAACGQDRRSGRAGGGAVCKRDSHHPRGRAAARRVGHEAADPTRGLPRFREGHAARDPRFRAMRRRRTRDEPARERAARDAR